MSRSYHANRKKLEEHSKQNVSHSNHKEHYFNKKRIQGEIIEKREYKRKAKQLRKIKNSVPDVELKDILLKGNANKKISINEVFSEDIIFTISQEDIQFVIGNFTPGELVHVKEINLEYIKTDYNEIDIDYIEILPGIKQPYISGQYNHENKKISVSGIIVSNNNYDFIRHLFFYFKVCFLSTLAHEIFHNIDINSFRLRKGFKNSKKSFGAEAMARYTVIDYYLEKIVPYIKDKYKEEYNDFMLWMKSQSVLPLELEYWNPSLTDWISGYDGIPELFKNVFYDESEVKRNLDIANGLHLGEHIEKALAYIEYVLSDIEENNYEALKLKAHILWDEERKYKEAELVYQKLYKIKPEDSEMLSDYIQVLMRKRNYKLAYKLLKIIKPNRYQIIDFIKCLWYLKKHDELDKLITDLENSESFIGGISNTTVLMFAYSIKCDYKTSLWYFKLLHEGRLGYFEKSWTRYVAAKIYLVKKEYNKVGPLLIDDDANDYFEISYKIKRLKEILLKRQSNSMVNN